MKWEYLILDHPHRDLLLGVLNDYGERGWELVNSGYEGGATHSLIFKRRVEDEAI